MLPRPPSERIEPTQRADHVAVVSSSASGGHGLAVTRYLLIEAAAGTCSLPTADCRHDL
jgi:hypothetical protein